MILKTNNCVVFSKTYGIFTFNAFRAIKGIIDKNKTIYKKVWFKKIPLINSYIPVRCNDIFLKFLIFKHIKTILLLLNYIKYKLSFTIRLIYNKYENNNWDS